MTDSPSTSDKQTLRPIQETHPIGILVQREIEARIVAPIYEELVKRLGREEARQIIEKAVQADAEEAGREFAKDVEPGDEMRHFIEIQKYWEQDDALDTDHLEESDKRYSYDVHRCSYAEMYKRLGLSDLGYILSCARDFAFARGYNEKLGLDRQSTIMMGAEVCPFRYLMQEKGPGHMDAGRDEAPRAAD